MKCLILASRSPRRAKILDWAGIPYKCLVPPGVAEERLGCEGPAEMVQRLALKKAAAARKLDPLALVLAGDTVVALGNRIFGKPRNASDARRMLLALEGKWHQVWTGVALLGPRKRPIVFAECTGVRFGSIPRRELRSYLRTRIPYDKAGGYDIQGRAGEWIERIQGDYLNIMGLPLQRTLMALGKGGPQNGFDLRPKGNAFKPPKGP